MAVSVNYGNERQTKSESNQRFSCAKHFDRFFFVISALRKIDFKYANIFCCCGDGKKLRAHFLSHSIKFQFLPIHYHFGDEEKGARARKGAREICCEEWRK